MSEQPQPPRSRLPGILATTALIALIAYVTFNTLSSERGSSTGPLAGEPMAQFAAPLVDSSLEGDVNVIQRSGSGTVACDVKGARVLNSCQLVANRPAALIFINDSDGRCANALDDLVAAARRFPKLNVAAIVIGGQRDAARTLISDHRWRVPVAQDRDGALANLYGVAVCPQIVYLRRGGVVDGVSVGDPSAAELQRRLAAISEVN